MDLTKLSRDERNRLVHGLPLEKKTNPLQKIVRELIENLAVLPEQSRINEIQKIVDELNETTLLSNFTNK